MTAALVFVLALLVQGLLTGVILSIAIPVAAGLRGVYGTAVNRTIANPTVTIPFEGEIRSSS